MHTPIVVHIVMSLLQRRKVMPSQSYLPGSVHGGTTHFLAQLGSLRAISRLSSQSPALVQVSSLIDQVPSAAHSQISAPLVAPPPRQDRSFGVQVPQ
jgi:hypothetical protein